jgi:hypothetical protein
MPVCTPGDAHAYKDPQLMVWLLMLRPVWAGVFVHGGVVHPSPPPPILVKHSQHPRPSCTHTHPTPYTQVRARFVERFSMGAPFAGGEVRGPVIKDMSDRVSWVEKFVRVGSAAQTEAQAQQQQQQQHSPTVSGSCGSQQRGCVWSRAVVADCS